MFSQAKKVCTLKKLSWCSLTSIGKLVLKDLTSSKNICKFFVLEKECLSFIDSDDSVWEEEPIKRLASSGKLTAYYHNGFWQPMDTLRDKKLLERFWNVRQAPWKVWV